MALPNMANADWSGFYTGVEIGGIDGAPVGGAFAGAQYQLWAFVAGIEISYDTLLGDTNNGAPSGLDYFSVGYRLGWAFDEVLGYLGVAGSSTDTEDTDLFDIQAVFELGFDYRYTDTLTVGVQYKSNVSILQFSEDDDTSIDGLSLRVAYQF